MRPSHPKRPTHQPTVSEAAGLAGLTDDNGDGSGSTNGRDGEGGGDWGASEYSAYLPEDSLYAGLMALAVLALGLFVLYRSCRGLLRLCCGGGDSAIPISAASGPGSSQNGQNLTGAGTGANYTPVSLTGDSEDLGSSSHRGEQESGSGKQVSGTYDTYSLKTPQSQLEGGDVEMQVGDYLS